MRFTDTTGMLREEPSEAQQDHHSDEAHESLPRVHRVENEKDDDGGEHARVQHRLTNPAAVSATDDIVMFR